MPITYVLILLIHGLLGIGQDRVVNLHGFGVLMMELICMFGILVVSKQHIQRVQVTQTQLMAIMQVTVVVLLGALSQLLQLRDLWIQENTQNFIMIILQDRTIQQFLCAQVIIVIQLISLRKVVLQLYFLRQLVLQILIGLTFLVRQQREMNLIQLMLDIIISYGLIIYLQIIETVLPLFLSIICVMVIKAWLLYMLTDLRQRVKLVCGRMLEIMLHFMLHLMVVLNLFQTLKQKVEIGLLVVMRIMVII